jgi:predicted metal-dependent phosphoesterase TrpH
MKYKINIHAHSIFSDGINSPLGMALRAKELGFSALVLTDHFYGKKFPDVSMTSEKWYLFRKSVAEAKKVLPVITGIEVPMLNQEVLVFGSVAVQEILKNGKPTKEEVKIIKKTHHCALILCHPGTNLNDAAELVDGFEHYNSGCNFFKERNFGPLDGLPRWCNSDAHQKDCLGKAYNIVDTKIETEQDLIKYIKRGKQPEFYVRPLK